MEVKINENNGIVNIMRSCVKFAVKKPRNGLGKPALVKAIAQFSVQRGLGRIPNGCGTNS